MSLGGYANRIARVDLTQDKVEYERPSEEDLRKYIGGRGLGVKYVLDNGPKAEAFSEENILCFMLGPLVGSEVTMSGRMALVTKSPLTGTVTDSHHGGWSGARLRWAGFDGLIFRGQATKPVYAYVENGKVTLKDASHLWGKNVHDTVKATMGEYGKNDTSVVTIGQAGEKLVRFAAAVNENDRASGRGGTGAVMGWKKLKCLVIKGTIKEKPKPTRPEEFKKAVALANTAIVKGDVTGPRKGGLSVFGTNVLMNIVNEVGGLPTRNAQATQFEHADMVSGETVKETILVGDPTCHACPVACKKEVEVKEGKYKVHVESTEYESMWSLGANCGCSNKEAIAYMVYLTNDYGVDTIEMGNCISVAMEASERGLIKEKIHWGDADAMIDLIHKTARREGLGDALAEGCWRAGKKFGDEGLGNQVKGQSIAAYDPRGLQGMGIGYATSNRGACHLRGYTPASEVLGVPEKTDPLAWEGKGKLLKIFQDLHAISDSFDICKFNAFAEGINEYVAQYVAMTGVDIDADGLMKTGERIYNLERYYNNLNGFTGKDDTLPEKFLKKQGSGPATGHVCELNKMKKEYYEARGWVDGVVPESKLRELQIIT
ncbi:MAG TPA: aldehyde ferredoxin oxidoreductase family protein [Candidatus Acidoferrales bacterium]|nr:aldehyde ferredoxin oxidoreductase family protein [Candidatus Acidoferrales bacterium]